MTALLRKELRALLPLAALVVAVMAGADLIYQPLTERLDEVGWVSLNSDMAPGRGGTHAILLLVLSLLVAYSAFPREHDDGTIEFLYSLPVTRRQVFAAKAGAGALVLVGGVVAEHVLQALYLQINPQSYVGGQWRLSWALAAVGSSSAFAVVCLSYGLLLSFFRKFGLIALAAAIWVILLLKEREPALARLDLANLLRFEYQGYDLVVAWGELGVHAALGAVALLVAYLLWMGPAHAFHRNYVEAHTGAGGAALGCCGTSLVVMVLFAFVAFLADSDDDGPSPKAGSSHYVSWQTADAETRHYRFRYPTSLRGRALALIGDADAAYGAVQAFLGAEARERIVVDLTEVSDHHAGITGWQKIRMGLAGDRDDAFRLRVFHHETTHAFQQQVSDRRMAENGTAARFFAEGSAEYVAFELVPAPEVRRWARRAALATWKRQQVRFEDLANGDRFAARHDTNAVYAIGETWTAALVEAYGRGALGDVLRAMGRADAPRGLAPSAFWQDTLQAAGYDLEHVVAVWEDGMHELEREEAAFLEALPRLGGGVARSDDEEVVFVAVLDRLPLPGTRFRLRVRDRSGASDTETQDYVGARFAVDRVRFSVPRSHLRGRTFEYQFGQVFEVEAWPYFEEWQIAPVPR